MAKKRRRSSTPHMLLWSKSEQRRFVDAVEAMIAATRELVQAVADMKQKLTPRPKAPRPARKMPEPEQQEIPTSPLFPEKEAS